jgi:hypothetical protein
MFTSQEETEDEDSVSLAEILEIILKKWPRTFGANDIAEAISSASTDQALVKTTLREFLYPGSPASDVSPRSVGKQLKLHLDNPVQSGNRVLVLRTVPKAPKGKGSLIYFVHAGETGEE